MEGFRAKLAKKREAMKHSREVRDAAEKAAEQANKVTVERWSGLKIAGRCIRSEKLDTAMLGKQIVPIGQQSSLRSRGSDRVLIGVLCVQPSAPRQAIGSGNLICYWSLTDLHKTGPQRVTLILAERAMEHWGSSDGAGFLQVKVGSIFAVLNPALENANTIRVGFESQVIKLGMCPSFASCSAKLASGMECGEPYDADDGATYCIRHSAMSAWDRCREMEGSATGRARNSRVDCGRVASKVVSRSGNGVAVSSSVKRDDVRGELVVHPASTNSAGKELLPQRKIPEQASTALELLLLVLDEVYLSTEQLLAALRELEALDDIQSAELAKGEAYEALGAVVVRQDAAASAASKLRRRWRVLAADRGQPLQQELACQVLDFARTGGGTATPPPPKRAKAA